MYNKELSVLKGDFTMKFIIKLVFKIIAIPFVVALTIITAFMKFTLFLSGWILCILSIITGLGGVITLINGNTYAGVGLLVMAFLVSPFGLPAVAEWFVGLLDDMNYSLKGFIAG